MRNTLIWTLITVMMVLAGGMGGDVLAADRQGKVRAAAEDDARSLVFNTVTAITNTNAVCKDNGLTTRILVTFTNSSDETVDIWLQHGETSGGPNITGFANAIATAMVFNPDDLTSYKHTGNVPLDECVRFHIEDSDITSNNVGIKLKAH